MCCRNVFPFFPPIYSVTDLRLCAVVCLHPPLLFVPPPHHPWQLSPPPLSAQAWGNQWRLNVASISQAHHVAMFIGPALFLFSFFFYSHFKHA